MYVPFFGLQHTPFSIAPDPRYLFMSDRHREALAHLLYGLDAGGGFVLLTGEVGAGKTTVCRCFLEQIPAHCDVAYIFNPKLTVSELLRSVCDELGVAHQPAVAGVETVKDCIDPLNDALLQAHAAGRNTVLIIDEAQNLSADVLEQLRLLTNLETSERKLLQIILIGQPELRAMVASPVLEQLAQRVTARFHLGALSALETQQYIAHRLAVAGLQGPVPFTQRAIRRIHALSRGVPRRINLLCDRALLGAYSAGVHEVGVTIVNCAAREVFGAPALSAVVYTRRRGVPAWASMALGACAGAAGVIAAVVYLGAGHLLPLPGSAAVGDGVAPVPSNAAPSAAAALARASVALKQSASASPAMQAPVGALVVAAPMAPALHQFLLDQPASDGSAWQGLASAWGAVVPEGADACTALARKGLRCYRNRRAGLNLVRQMDRPALLALFVSDTNDVAVSAVLRQLDGDVAVLEGAGRTLRVPVAELAQVWRGDITTLWRSPPGMPDKGEITDTPAGARWLDQQLAAKAAGGVGAGVDVDLKARPVTPAMRQSHIQRFQLAQGVTTDGRAGPLTLMLLNRIVGVSEPRLRTGA